MKNKIKAYLAKKIADIVQTDISSLDMDANLLELGLDSETLVRFSEEFEQEIDIKLYPTIFFEYQTPNQVVEYFSKEFAQKFDTFFKISTLDDSLLDPQKEITTIKSHSTYAKKYVSSVDDKLIKEGKATSSVTTNQSIPILWVNLGEENILKSYELRESLDATVTSLDTTEDYVTDPSTRIIIYGDKKTLLNNNLIFLILKFLNRRLKGEKPCSVQLLVDEEVSKQKTFRAFTKYFTSIPYNDITNCAFDVSLLHKFDVHNIQYPDPVVYQTKRKPDKEVNQVFRTDFERSIRAQDIAIIGADGRFPQSPNLDIYWENLLQQKDLIGRPDSERYNMWKELFGEGFLKQSEIYGGFIDDVDKFDHEFFKISAREAQVMDPQQRVFLESSWKCIQHAGYDSSSLSGSNTGVFGAVGTRDYHELSLLYSAEIEPQMSTGLAHSILANRVSYIFNLHGPSEIIDTACSSSLVALHRAIKSIHNNECDQAIVGGVNLNLSPLVFIAFYKTGILSSQGRCRSFDEKANGYVRGEGVGTIFIKPLSKAIEDGDYIHGVVTGTSVNHGGKGRSLTAPNPSKQSEVISKAIKNSECHPSSITYIEAHGTGTALGDPIEIEGLKYAFKSLQSKKNDSEIHHCEIGSVKSNIGHLETAAGIAGLLKVLQSFNHRKIPASIHVKNVNPLISLKNSPFSIIRETKSWESGTKHSPLRAGVSSFGFGGTNAHVILESFENHRNKSPVNEELLCFPFSAPTQEQLNQYLLLFSKKTYDFSLNHIAFTLQKGRDLFPVRCIFEAKTFSCLLKEISRYLNGEDTTLSNDKAKSWLNGNNVKWTTLGNKVPLPTFPLLKVKHWFELKDKAEFQRIHSQKTAVSNQIIELDRSNGTTDEYSIEDFLTKEIASLLKREPKFIDKNTSFLDYGLDSVLGIILVKKLEEKLSMPIYINELLTYDSIDKLSSYLKSEIRQTRKATDRSTIVSYPNYIDKGEQDIVFLLSTPRTGSTLMRTMLMGNQNLFAPPEMHLLNFRTLGDRYKWLKNTPLYEGILETIKVLYDISLEEARMKLNYWERSDTLTIDIYKEFQVLLKNQILVDKSPSYAENIATLQQAEEWFKNAKYIVLYRHPFDVMESIVTNRFHRLIPIETKDKASPYEIAEDIWMKYNRNIEKFIHNVSKEKYLEVNYEDLVTQSEWTMKRICDFLEIRFDKAMLSPYEKNRLIFGLTDHSLSVGDPNFLNHNSINSNLSNAWIDRPGNNFTLRSHTADYAISLGYDLAHAVPVTPLQKEYLKKQEKISWGIAHHFEFSSKQEVSKDRLSKCLSELFNIYTSFHRQLNVDLQKWCWTNDKSKLFKSLFSSKEHKDFFESFVIKHRSDIHSVNGVNMVIHIIKLNDHNYQGAILYNHLLGDGISSLQLINFIVSELTGEIANKSAIRKMVVARLTGSKLEIPNIICADTHAAIGSQQEVRLVIGSLSDHIEQNDLFGVIGSSYVKVILQNSTSKENIIAIRSHNRQTILDQEERQHKANFDVGLYAIDVPVNVCDAHTEPTSFKELVYNETKHFKNVIFHGKFRLNFQPLLELNVQGKFNLLNSSETLAANAVPDYEIDSIVRQYENELEIIVRYNDQVYSNNQIKEFLREWQQNLFISSNT